jgi:hypothetical protein
LVFFNNHQLFNTKSNQNNQSSVLITKTKLETVTFSNYELYKVIINKLLINQTAALKVIALSTVKTLLFISYLVQIAFFNSSGSRIYFAIILILVINICLSASVVGTLETANEIRIYYVVIIFIYLYLLLK